MTPEYRCRSFHLLLTSGVGIFTVPTKRLCGPCSCQPKRMHFDSAAWARYRTVNERFAHHIAKTAVPGATVWLHDYNVWLVPGLLRAARRDLKIRSVSSHAISATRNLRHFATAPEIRTSLRCLDWAGIHTSTFADRFSHAVGDPPRPPRVGVHPLGIDRKSIEALARTRAAHRQPATGPLVVSIERLDYIKAPLEKIEAIATLPSRCPELRGHLRFRLVCAPPEPGITAYETTRQALERRITQINQTWSVGHWQPIEYLPHTLSFAKVIDSYLAADVF